MEPIDSVGSRANESWRGYRRGAVGGVQDGAGVGVVARDQRFFFQEKTAPTHPSPSGGSGRTTQGTNLKKKISARDTNLRRHVQLVRWVAKDGLPLGLPLYVPLAAGGRGRRPSWGGPPISHPVVGFHRCGIGSFGAEGWTSEGKDWVLAAVGWRTGRRRTRILLKDV